MAIEVTPLGFKKPDDNELSRDGNEIISDNAQKAQDLIADLQTRVPSHFDGGSPNTVYAADQFIDGGTT